MKANELMIGDWVFLDGIPKRLNLWDIVSVSRKFYDADPIPITEEILKANDISTSGESIFFKHCEYLELTWHHGKLWWTTNGAEYDILPFDYVHELQHALRLCGLNELADNFKVE